MQPILVEELVSMGAVKSNLDNFVLRGISYSRSISFSQRVQIAAERMCQEYQKQGIKCLLVQDGIVLTLWLSQPFKAVMDAIQTASTPTEVQFQQPSATSENETSFEANSASKIKSPSVTREKIMTYRGNMYKVSTNENNSLHIALERKTEGLKKRIYRGLKY
ncbi:hypothetical protein [Calothrix sp. PCC 6303]|uniref:hypothetical protein n=1 Tax=Calothrix sp. PCC 6303 TaxID=1170562 RepID=UPI0002A0081B|nr:hypothetical protein [Calothrix sp. PCC 6303]AFZ00995.1 hypothetical protein Cal6303_1961 [Calothrix sp. PCC 6303]